MRKEEEVRDDALAWLRTQGPVTAGALVGCLDLEDTWTDRELYELPLDDVERTSDPWQGPGRVMDLQRLRALLNLT